MDSNNRDIRPKKYDEKSLEKLENKIVFNNDSRYTFIFKKTEKIVAALYLITNLIKDTEPLKWKLRDITLNLLAETMLLQNPENNHKKSAIKTVAGLISEITAFSKIAYLSELLSEMNYTILVRELSFLFDTLDQYSEQVSAQGSVVLSQDFFTVPEGNFSHPVSSVRSNIESSLYKGHNLSDKSIKDKETPNRAKDGKKDERRETIIKLLKDGKVLSIKEFSRQIKDCSEKTIQRELLALVQEGVLNKKGERRWSMYSLK